MDDGGARTLSVDTAAFLCSNRKHLPKKLFLNVVGTVTAKSECFRVNNSHFFFINLDQHLTIVVKDFQLQWYSLLYPSETYVFHNLRLTTFGKGLSKPKSVLLVWRSSSFDLLSNKENVETMLLQDWLEKHNLQNLIDYYHIQDHDPEIEDRNEQLINYEGTVTSTEESSDCIVELDDRLILVGGTASSQSTIRYLKKHDRITIYNAHMIKQEAKEYLVACMKSCIKWSRTSQSSEESDNSEGEAALNFKHLSEKYGLNLKETLAALSLRDSLAKYGQNRALSAILETCTLGDEIASKVSDQFIFHSECCPFIASKAHQSRVPDLMVINTIKEHPFSYFTSPAGSSDDVTTSSGEQSSFRFTTVENKVLVGQLTVTAGETLVMKDSTGYLPVVVFPGTGENWCHRRYGDAEDLVERDISVESDNSRQQLQTLSQHPFPVLDTSLLDANICVMKFHIIIENTNNGKLIYLAFAASDLFPGILKSALTKTLNDCYQPSTSGIAHQSFTKKIVSQPSRKINMQKRCGGNISELTCFVTEKQSLTYKNVQNGNKILHFTAIGIKFCPCHASRVSGDSLDKKYGQTTSKRASSDMERYSCNVPEFSATGISNVNAQCHGFPKRKRKITDEDVEAPIKSRTKNKTASKDASDTTICSSCPGHAKATKCLSICMSFQGTACKWYHFIMPGHTYRFISTENSDQFQPQFYDMGLRRAAECFYLRVEISLPYDVCAEYLQSEPTDMCLQEESKNQLPKVHSITEILSDSFTDKVVSFRGIVVSRTGCASSSINRSGGNLMINTKLEVRHLSSDEHGDLLCEGAQLAVFLDAVKAVQILGIVGGSEIIFCNLERKVSKKGNVYCRFIHTSSLQVVKFHALDQIRMNSPPIAKTPGSYANAPKEWLITIWEQSVNAASENSLWQISCHVYMLSLLSIKAVCTVCRGSYRKHSCQNGGCRKYGPPKILARAVAMVEDGTCQAKVTLWDEQLVSQFLTLSREQWAELVSVVSEEGDLLIHRFEPLSSSTLPTAEFLDVLTKSPVVLRPCKMVVRRSKNFSLPCPFDKMRLEDCYKRREKLGGCELTTLSLPTLQLDCQYLSEWD